MPNSKKMEDLEISTFATPNTCKFQTLHDKVSFTLKERRNLSIFLHQAQIVVFSKENGMLRTFNKLFLSPFI